MLGFIGDDTPGCTDYVENYRLDNAGDYMRLVSSGMKGLGCGADCNCPCNKKSVSGLGRLNDVLGAVLPSTYGSWPPGPQPEPYKWTDQKTGTTWTLVKVDNHWMYQSSKDSRYYITPSNLYSVMGVKKDPDTFEPTGKIPGEPNPGTLDWLNWKVGTLGAGWVLLGGVGLYMFLNRKKRGR